MKLQILNRRNCTQVHSLIWTRKQ